MSIRISDPSLTLATVLGPNDLLILDQVDITQVTGYKTKNIKGSAFYLLGGPFISEPNYGGSNVGVMFQGVKGTIATPTTDIDAPFIFQKASNISGNAGNNSTMLISHDMYAPFGSPAATVTWCTGLTVMATDKVGGAAGSNARFYEAFRAMAVIPAGVCGNPAGIITAAIANAGSTFATGLVAIEAQTFNATGVDQPAPSSLNPNFIACSYMASNFATNKCDAAFYANHFSPSPFRTGVFIASNSVDHTAFYNQASVVNGIDLSTGSYSGQQIAGIGFTIDPTGILTVSPSTAASIKINGAAATSSQLQISINTTQIAAFYGDTTQVIISAVANIPIKFNTNNALKATLNASGGFYVGSTNTDPGANNIGVQGVYKVAANQVVGARVTGYTAMTGSADKATSYATGSVTLAQLAGRVMQLQADLTTHGLIGA